MDNMLGVTLHDARGPLNDLLAKLASDRGEVWLRELKKFLRQEPTFEVPLMGTTDQLARWQKLFENSGIDCAVGQVTLPERQPGFDRLIVVPKGLSVNKLVEIMLERFDMWYDTEDNDQAITHAIINSDRSNEESTYAIWVRDNVEADEEHKNCPPTRLPRRLLALRCWNVFSTI